MRVYVKILPALFAVGTVLSPSAGSAEELILKCDTSLRFPFQGFDQPRGQSDFELLVKFNTDLMSGTYNGFGPINEKYPGSLHITDDFYDLTSTRRTMLVNSWIVDELLRINRYTGELSHSMKLEDGRFVWLFWKGKCKKMDSPLF